MQPPSSINSHPLRPALTSVSILIFATPMLAYIACALMRLGTPVELEWMEGGSLQMLLQILSDKPLYGPPGVDFVPYTYTPLYFYVSALLSGIFGANLFTLRLVSFTASLASFIFLYLIVRRETRSVLAGAAAVGLFAGSYAVNGNWFDVARIDSLCMSLALAAMWLGLGEPRARTLMLGGALIALSFFTKQVALVVSGPLLCAVVASHGRKGLLFVSSAILTLLIGTLYLQITSDGWFLFYALESPRTRWQSNLSLYHLARAALLEFLPIFMIPLAISIPLVCNLIRRPSRKGLSLLLSIGGLFLAAAWGRVESLNFLNSSIPAHLGVAILFGLTVGDFLGDGSKRLGLLTILVAFALQILFFATMLGPIIPSKQELSNYTAYSSRITSLAKPVYLPDQGYVSILGSDSSFAHSIGIMDLMMGGSAEVIGPFRREMEEALNAQRFGTIVCDTPLFLRWFQEPLERNYQLVATTSDNVPWTPVLGFRNQPTVFVRRGRAAPAS